MDLLARREHSRLELLRKLERRFPESALLEQVLDHLVTDNLLSDSRFCEAFVRQRVGKHTGPVRIRAELRQRGVDEQLIAQNIDAYNGQWLRQLEALIVRKYGAAPTADKAELVKRQRFLLQRGFSYEQIGRVLSL